MHCLVSKKDSKNEAFRRYKNSSARPRRNKVLLLCAAAMEVLVARPTSYRLGGHTLGAQITGKFTKKAVASQRNASSVWIGLKHPKNTFFYHGGTICAALSCCTEHGLEPNDQRSTRQRIHVPLDESFLEPTNRSAFQTCGP